MRSAMHTRKRVFGGAPGTRGSEEDHELPKLGGDVLQARRPLPQGLFGDEQLSGDVKRQTGDRVADEAERAQNGGDGAGGEDRRAAGDRYPGQRTYEGSGHCGAASRIPPVYPALAGIIARIVTATHG